MALAKGQEDKAMQLDSGLEVEFTAGKKGMMGALKA